MAATISDLANGTSIATTATLVTGATVTASVGDWLVVIVAAENHGASGDRNSLTNVVDSDGVNTYTERVKVTYSPGVTSAGATLGIYTCAVTSALSNDTITANFSPNTTEKAIQVYKVVPGAGETISFIAADTTGILSNTNTYAANTVSVTNGDIIFGAASIETDDAITGASDVTNGSWSTVITRLADNGADASTQSCVSQYKTVNATGDQSWAATSSTARDSAVSYLVLRSASANKTIAIGAAAYAYTPTAVTLHKGYTATIGAASYSFSPQAVTLRRNLPLVVGSASYAYTPTAVTLRHAWKFDVGAASYSFTAQDVALNKGQKIVIGAASYSFTPTDVSLLHGWQVAVGAASYAFTAQNVTLRRNLPLSVGAASFSFTPSDVTLLQARKLTVGAASYSFSAQDVSLKHDWNLAVGAVSYAFTAQDVTLTKTAAGAFSIAIDPASYSFGAQAVTLLHGWKVSVETASYSFTPSDVTLTLGAVAAPAVAETGGGWSSDFLSRRRTEPAPEQPRKRRRREEPKPEPTPENIWLGKGTTVQTGIVAAPAAPEFDEHLVNRIRTKRQLRRLAHADDDWLMMEA